MIGEADLCCRPGELGALLRREGLYSGAINRWRKELQESTLSSSRKPKRKETPSQENARLKRQNARLTEKLRQAELIIDVQKKVSEMIQTRSQEGRLAAAEKLGKQVGVAAACRSLDVSRATLYRRRRGTSASF